MKDVQRSKAVILAQKFLWIGTALALFYWFLESLIHVAVFEGGDFLGHLFPPDAHEIWKRLLVIVLMILFSIYAQRSINIRRRTEAALAEREKELSRIFENNPAAIMLIDAATRKVTWINSNATKLIGSPKKAIENQTCHQHLCQTEIGFCPILDGDMQSVDFSEQVLTTAGGDQVPILKSITRVNYNGKEHLLETFFDLSDRKKMERDLQQAHAELDQIFQTASVAMRLVDRNFNVLKINNTFERLTDISEANAIGKKCHEIFSGPTCFTEECPIQRVINGMETVESYVDKTRTDGKSIPCILTASPFLGPNGDIVGVVESFRDITELTKAQDAVESERDKLERILSHLHEGVIIISGEYQVEYQNDIFNTYFGDCEGKTCYSVIHGLSQPCKPCLMKTALEEGRIQQAEFEMPDGRNFERSYTPVAEGDAQQRVVALLRDVTGKKAATAAIMRAEQLAALGELAAGVAHEINNPINGIINYAQILVNTTEEGDRVHEIAARVIKEGDRIARIVEGLLSFARRRHEDKSVISINEILADSMALTAAQLRSDNIVVNTDIPDNLPDVRVQAHEIEQVFVNIISNARHALNEKYPGPHEDKILEVNATTISSKDKAFIRVSFRDNGTGIPAAIIDKVMNPFFSTKTERKRTGLGLSISHGILDEHGGKLNIESEEGKYTKVIMELPALQKTKH